MKVLDYILDWFFPTKCPFCGKLTERFDIKVCKDCEKNLPRVQSAAQVQKFKHIDACVAPMYYEGIVKESVRRYKFSGKNGYGHVYADFMLKAIDENAITCDIITWVPIHRKRYRERGYDQSAIIARDIARKKGAKCTGLLKKWRSNPPQSGSGGKEARKANVAGVYKVINKSAIKGKTILIVDDVVTTGSTLSECASMLKAAGAAKVYAAAFARHKD